MNSCLTGTLQKIEDSKGAPYLAVVIDSDRAILDAGWRHLHALGLQNAVAARHARDGMHIAHVTIAGVAEWGGLVKYKPEVVSSIQLNIGSSVKMQFHGIGCAKSQKHPNTSWYGVLSCDIMNTLRTKMGLRTKDFHVTFAFEPKDVFDAAKGIDTIIIPLDHLLNVDNAYNSGPGPC